MASTTPAGAGKTLVLVDGSALLYRSHFAFIRNPLRSSKGEVTSAAFGALQALLPLLDQRRPDRVAVVFDTAAPTFRHRVYAEYKAHRPPMPADLVAQIPRVREVIRLLGLPIVEQEGVEADDLIGSLAKEAERDGATTLIVTGDKDFYQIVSESIQLLAPKARAGELSTVDRGAVQERYGVAPEEMVDLLALMGDASDNVPGVPGIGEKTAAQLIQRFHSLDRLYASLDQVERASIREKLKQNEERARLSQRLATIRHDLPLEHHWTELVRAPIEYARLIDLLEELELRVLARRFREEERAAGDLFPELVRPTAERSQRADAPPADRSARIAPGDRPPYGDYRVVGDGAGLEALARVLEAARGPVAFDTETTGLNPLRADLVGISIAPEEGRAYYLPIGHGAGPNLDPDRVREALRPFFASPRAERAAQNAKYDWHVLERFGIPVRDVAFDTMVAAYLVDPDQPKNIDALAKSRLGLEKIATETLIGRGRDQVSMAALPVDRVAEYCCEDADACLRLVAILGRELASGGVTALFHEVEMPLIGVLVRMERAGIKVDVETLDAMGRELGERLAALDHRIQEEAGVPFNVNSPRQLAEVLFERLKLPRGKRTREGYSTDTEVLEGLATLHPIARLMLEYRLVAKLKSSYVDSLPRLVNPETGRVHATFHQTIASTGRLSASDPSLQNIPIRSEEGRAIRRAFVAEGGRGLLASFDYSQIELRLLAHLSHDPVLQEAFRGGGDVHATTASRLFGVPVDQVTAAQRGQAKVVNFGIIYGMGPARLARELSLSRALATAFIDEYKRTHAGVASYLTQVLREARERGYVETILKRRRPLPGLKDANEGRRAEAERAAVNAPIQGSAADLIKVAMVKIDALVAERGLRSRLILQVHDELLFETDESEIEVLAPLVLETMQHALPLRVPLEVHQGRGRTWDDAHA
ncbi:MAG TPA: DNA polymerase I [Candidatus Eisenbacteria bacterium]